MLGWEPEVGAPGLLTCQLNALQQHAAPILWPSVSSPVRWGSGTGPHKWSLGAFPEWKFFGLFLRTTNKMLPNISSLCALVREGYGREVSTFVFLLLFFLFFHYCQDPSSFSVRLLFYCLYFCISATYIRLLQATLTCGTSKILLRF